MIRWDLTAFAEWNICVERSRYGYDAPHGNFSRPRRWTLRQLRQIYDEAFAGSRMFMRVCTNTPAITGRMGATTKKWSATGFGPDDAPTPQPLSANCEASAS